MKNPIVLLFNEAHPIDEILEDLEGRTKINDEELDLSQPPEDSDEEFIFYTPNTQTAIDIKEYFEAYKIKMFGVNIIPCVNGDVLRRAQGDNPFDTRYVDYDPSTVAHLIEINSHSYFYPRGISCAV